MPKKDEFPENTTIVARQAAINKALVSCARVVKRYRDEIIASAPEQLRKSTTEQVDSAIEEAQVAMEAMGG